MSTYELLENALLDQILLAMALDGELLDANNQSIPFAHERAKKKVAETMAIFKDRRLLETTLEEEEEANKFAENFVEKRSRIIWSVDQ